MVYLNSHGRMVMAVIEITSQKEFMDLIQAGVTLIDFHAQWCAPCWSQAPIIDELDKRYNGLAVVAKLDIDDNRSLAANYGIQSIPTVIIFKDGSELKRFIGLQASGAIETVLEKALE